jgi:FdhE protein
MTCDVWLDRHPYLQPIADMRALVDAAAVRVAGPAAPLPRWQEYVSDFQAGVPLLDSERAGVPVSDPVGVVLSMLDALTPISLPAWLASQCRELNGDLRRPGESASPVHPALFRCLLWAALARQLEPVVTAFDLWRDEERWLRNYCPTCGAAPAMAQLVGRDAGRLRLLSCGCCRSRWRYRRTGCPFCERADDHRLAVLAVQGEDGLRVDYCERCRGYLKTYDGEGSECVLLADWTSLHLDLLARDRGLKRLAASLYQV